jgi:dolichyl-phosphate beta-glucosyltransferase
LPSYPVSVSHYHFVDADGATEFGSGLEKLIEKLCLSTQNPNQPKQQMISIFGSRAHMQEESTTTRSIVRTLLMRVFHFFVSLLVSSSIQDTQCGFKLFTKEASQAVFGNLKLQRWAFDTEVVLLCKYLRIDIYEVPVHWQEIDGSKLNTSKWALAIVSITMLRDMICVRACYLLGIWNVSKVVSKDQVR